MITKGILGVQTIAQNMNSTCTSLVGSKVLGEACNGDRLDLGKP